VKNEEKWKTNENAERKSDISRYEKKWNINS
jgi:hypothetical protein